MEIINRRLSLREGCVPNPVNLLSHEGERQLTGETVAEIVDVQLYSGHGR
jgi:hypothetical protein